MTTIFGINDDGQVLREHEIAALPESQQDALELYVEDDDGSLHTLDEAGDMVPAELEDLIGGLDESHRMIFTALKANSSFPDAADAAADYLQRMSEKHGIDDADMKAATEAVTYDLYAEEQLSTAMVDTNIGTPTTFEEAFEQSKEEGLLPGRKKHARTVPASRVGLADAMDDFMDQISDRNSVQREARAAVRAAARERADAES